VPRSAQQISCSPALCSPLCPLSRPHTPKDLFALPTKTAIPPGAHCHSDQSQRISISHSNDQFLLLFSLFHRALLFSLDISIASFASRPCLQSRFSSMTARPSLPTGSSNHPPSPQNTPPQPSLLHPFAVSSPSFPLFARNSDFCPQLRRSNSTRPSALPPRTIPHTSRRSSIAPRP
jgi:hypothetical protein